MYSWNDPDVQDLWTLTAEESALLPGMTNKGMLGFAVQLKFMEMYGRFPENHDEIDPNAVQWLASQLKTTSEVLLSYKFVGRQGRRHRRAIRIFLGFRPSTIIDLQRLSQWLCDNILPFDPQAHHGRDRAFDWFRSQRLEPPATDYLDRIIRSAVHSYDTQQLMTIHKRLNTLNQTAIDRLLASDEPDDIDEAGNEESMIINFSQLKADPGKANLDGLLTTIDKLKCIDEIGLVTKIFQDIPAKFIDQYRQCCSAESIRELRRHPAAIRYSMVAMFCWRRQQQLIDALIDLLLQVIHNLGVRAEKRVEKRQFAAFKKVRGKAKLLFRLAEATVNQPDGVVAAKRDSYYELLKVPRDVEAFIEQIQSTMHKWLTTLHTGLPSNPKVRLRRQGKNLICLTRLDRQPEPTNIAALKREIGRRWADVELIDILKEVDLRVNFTAAFRSSANREVLDHVLLQRRLLLCLFGIGTNVGLKRVASQQPSVSFEELRHVKRRFIQKETLHKAIADIVNGTFRIRNPTIWGEATTACASDSKKFGAYDQNLMTEWHARYGGRGIMIYWHVDTNSTCIYSKLRRCSSSEVAAMMEGVLRHCTDMEIDSQYVDSHGQSEVAFSFSYILGFDLLPRLKAIARQKLYVSAITDAEQYTNLEPILTRAIKWDLIRQQYDEIIKYTTALRLGTAEPEAILRRFTRAGLSHPIQLIWR